MPKAKTFTEKVQNVVRNIPKGSVLTYQQVATKAGSPNAARAVGSIMKKNFDTSIPCHRVVRSDGTVGEYNRGGSKKKKQILKKEEAI
jgi:methylated-DNA-[protein]-cysteine S-methyltransferase